jgi:hypothetical protein
MPGGGPHRAAAGCPYLQRLVTGHPHPQWVVTSHLPTHKGVLAGCQRPYGSGYMSFPLIWDSCRLFYHTSLMVTSIDKWSLVLWQDTGLGWLNRQMWITFIQVGLYLGLICILWFIIVMIKVNSGNVFTAFQFKQACQKTGHQSRFVL